MQIAATIEQIKAAVGPRGCIADPQGMEPYLIEARGLYRGATLLVVRPASTAEVAAVVKICAEARLPIVPQGGNTGLVGGGVPPEDGHNIVLALGRMNRIRVIDPVNFTMTVEAGCILAHLQQAAAEADRLFPLSLGAEGSCQIGGNLSTNAGGIAVLRYGNTRELAPALEVVLASGEIWDGLRGLRKDNSGYDLKQAFIGSEGTLGVITAATLRLFALPRSRLTALAGLESIEAAIALLKRMRSVAGPTLTAFELMSQDSLQPVASMLGLKRLPMEPMAPWTVLLEISDHQDESHARSLLEAGLDATAGAPIIDAVLARTLAESDRLWRLREAIPEAQARAGGNVKHDISLPLSGIAAFVRETSARVTQEFNWAQLQIFGHLGDGNLHYNVGSRAPIPAQTAFDHESALNEIVYEAVRRHGGSFSAEHGLGQLKLGAAARYKSAIEQALMRSIKDALDPHGRMNP